VLNTVVGDEVGKRGLSPTTIWLQYLDSLAGVEGEKEKFLSYSIVQG
jgi:hypothetical protein